MDMTREIEYEGTEFREVCIIGRESFRDARGSFKRVLDTQLDSINIKQISFSTNKKSGTLRGIHGLAISMNETKVIECLSGSMFDVVVDFRKDSVNYLKWMGIKLSEESDTAIAIPPGFGHGFLTLEANTTVLYQMSCEYNPKFEIGYRFDDPRLGIQWPFAPTEVSNKDLAWKFLIN
jgi:dTDP-4-dehydrorhamnose 3,5-epimerase